MMQLIQKVAKEIQEDCAVLKPSRNWLSGDSRNKKVGGHLRGQGKSRRPRQISILHGDFSLFWRL